MHLAANGSQLAVYHGVYDAVQVIDFAARASFWPAGVYDIRQLGQGWLTVTYEEAVAMRKASGAAAMKQPAFPKAWSLKIAGQR